MFFTFFFLKWSEFKNGQTVPNTQEKRLRKRGRRDAEGLHFEQQPGTPRAGKQKGASAPPPTAGSSGFRSSTERGLCRKQNAGCQVRDLLFNGEFLFCKAKRVLETDGGGECNNTILCYVYFTTENFLKKERNL